MEQHHRQIGSMAFFTPEQLEDTPSRRDGMSADMERGYRRHAHQIIVAVCNALVIHHQSAYLAVYLCQRFYAVRSWRRNDRWMIMPAALSLALKMHERPKPVSHLLAEFEKLRWREHDRARPGEPRRAHDRAYIDGLKEPFALAERALLYALGFEFSIGDPYPHVASQMRALGMTQPGSIVPLAACFEVRQLAWNFALDSLATTLCLREPPERIAAAALLLALLVYGKPLALRAARADGDGGGPEEGEAPGEGAEVDATPAGFCEAVGVPPDAIEAIANEIMSLFVATGDAAPRLPVLAPRTPGADDGGGGGGGRGSGEKRAARPVMLSPLAARIDGDGHLAVKQEGGGHLAVKQEGGGHLAVKQEGGGHLAVKQEGDGHLAVKQEDLAGS